MPDYKTIIITLLFITSTIASFGQIKESITDKNKLWYNTIYIYMTMWMDTEVLGLGNDTTINDTTYINVLRAKGGIEGIGSMSGLLHNYDGRVGAKIYDNLTPFVKISDSNI